MTRIILDTDCAMGAPGTDVDDGFALALAHADPTLSLELVTTVNGNTDVDRATRLSLELLRRLGVEGDVPVVRGAATPLTHPERYRPPVPDIVDRYGVGLTPRPGYAPEQIARLVLANPGEITVVAIGPLTNIAATIALEPRFATCVKELVIMGGVFLGTTGHAGMPGEFNVFTDPEAAAAVLRCGAPQRWVGLDVTLRVRLTRAHARALADGSGPFGRFAGAAALAWIDYLGDDSCAMHDPLAVAAVAHPELLTWADVHVEVETGESVTRGVMAADWQRDGGGVGTLTPNCRVATDVDVVAALGYMTGTLAGL